MKIRCVIQNNKTMFFEDSEKNLSSSLFLDLYNKYLF